MKLKKIVALILFVVFLGLIVSACTNQSETTDVKTDLESLKNGYPIETDVALTMWTAQFAGVNTTALSVTNFGDTPIAKELEKQTGVKVTYQHPPLNQSSEQFNLMIASGTLPDIVEYNFMQYPGGSQQAIDDNVIFALNDLTSNYAPNLTKIYAADPELDKMVKTDAGNYYAYPQIRDSDLAKVFFGPIIRKDVLDRLGLDIPETISEWETMLTAMKNDGMKAPFSFTYNNTDGMFLYDAFAGAYGTSLKFFIDNQGKVGYGPGSEEYRKFLEIFSEWYKNGLIDNDFSIVDSQALDAKMIDGSTGAAVGLLSGGLLKWLDAGKQINPDYELVGAKYPVLEKGSKPFSGQKDFTYFPSYSSAITTKCKNPEVAAKWLDFAYSEQGRIIYSFGVENESFTMVDGKPQFTDLILNNPDGDSPNQVLKLYQKGNGAFLQHSDAIIFKYPVQKEAVELWADTDAEKHIMPPFLTPSTDDTEKYLDIMNEVTNYKNEMEVKFIMGLIPMSEYDTFSQTLKELGIDEAIRINQASYDRYKSR